MAFVRQGCALTLSLTLWAMVAQAEDQVPSPTGLYDRPVLVVDPGMHTAAIWSAAADQEGRWAVTGSDDKTVRVWSLADGVLQRTIRLPAGPGAVGKVYAVAISPDGALIAVAGRTTNIDMEQIYLFDRDTGALVQRIGGTDPYNRWLPSLMNVHHLAFSPDGAHLAAVLTGGLRVYSQHIRRAGIGWDEDARDDDYDKDDPSGFGSIFPDPTYGVDFARDGRLATTCRDGKIRLYAGFQFGSIKPTSLVEATGSKHPFRIAFSPDGTRLAVGYEDTPDVDLLDAHTLAPLPAWEGERGVAWHATRQVLQVLRITRGMTGPDLAGVDNGNLSEVAWSHDGATLFAAGTYGTPSSTPVLVWAGGGTGARRALPAGSDTVMGLVPLPGGDLLVASADPWLARLAPDGAPRWRHGPPVADFRDQFDSLSVSYDGSRVGFGFQQFGASPARFDLATRSLVVAPAADTGMAVPRPMGLPVERWRFKKGRLAPDEITESVAVHPDGDRFVVGFDQSLRAFDAQAKQLWRRAVPGYVWAVNISGDGRLVVAAYGDGTIRWHRMTDGVELLAFMPLANQTDWVAWTPEGFYAATAGAQRVLRWHVNRGGGAAADSVPITDTTGSYRPEVLPLVLQELETARALRRADMVEHDK
jgi:WD40 repeat protein